jgi:Trk-type K+ transport system membrane component
VIDGLDSMPRSLLFYRQQLQWFGGMGLIVLGVAVMPMLGIGGMQLYRAEAPGPLKEEKLTPRLTQTARALWLIYFALTLACAGGYWLAGMTPFDAVSHSLSTVSTGGFSTHDASMGHFAAPPSRRWPWSSCSWPPSTSASITWSGSIAIRCIICAMSRPGPFSASSSPWSCWSV